MKKSILAILLSVVVILRGLTGTVPADAAGKNRAPSGVFVMTGKKGNPVISWEKVEKASKYRVYRKTESDSTWVKAATTSKLKIRQCRRQ